MNFHLEGFEPFRSLYSRIGRAFRFCRKRQRRALLALSHNLACTRKRTILSDDPFMCRARRIRTFTMTESESVALPFGDSPIYVNALTRDTNYFVVNEWYYTQASAKMQLFFVFLYVQFAYFIRKM